MAAKRPTVMAALKSTLVAGVPMVDGRVFLPWDNRQDPREVGDVLQIDIGATSLDDAEVLGHWMHRVQVRISAICAGAFDYPAAWEILQEAATAINIDGTLGGVADSAEVDQCSDVVEVAGEKMLLPSLQCTINYLTRLGSL